jgi:hypothetical protein
MPTQQTNAAGEAEFLNVPGGPHHLTVNKQPYKTVDKDILVEGDIFVLIEMEPYPLPGKVTVIVKRKDNSLLLENATVDCA